MNVETATIDTLLNEYTQALRYMDKTGDDDGAVDVMNSVRNELARRDEALKLLADMPRWVPAGEYLPDEYELVPVKLDNGHTWFAMHNGAVWVSFKQSMESAVTHWLEA